MALLAGKVRISVSSPDGKEITLTTLQSGEIFGEIAVLDGRERTANAIAASDCRLAELERKDVLHFFDRHPGAWQSLVNVLCDRLRRTDQHLAELALLPLTSRLSITLLRAAEMQQVDGRSLIQVHLSQREIGNLVGVSRESVNKVMHEWQKAGLIMIKDQTIIITAPRSSRTPLRGALGFAKETTIGIGSNTARCPSWVNLAISGTSAGRPVTLRNSP